MARMSTRSARELNACATARWARKRSPPIYLGNKWSISAGVAYAPSVESSISPVVV